MKKRVVIVAMEFSVDFPCECGGTCTVISGQVSKLVHTLPFCEEFEKLPPDEYVRRNRERIAKGEN